METNGKNIKKYDAARVGAVKRLAKEHQIEPDTVRKMIRGERNGETAEKVRAAYQTVYNEIKRALNQ